MKMSERETVEDDSSSFFVLCFIGIVVGENATRFFFKFGVELYLYTTKPWVCDQNF